MEFETIFNKNSLLPFVFMGASCKKIKSMIDAGFDIHDTDCRGANALHYAAAKGNLSVLNLLLDENVKVDRINNYSETALFYAVYSSRLNTAKRLIECGADVNRHRYYNKFTPLHAAVKHSNTAMVKLLWDAGASMYAHDEDINNPYDLAVKLGKKALADFILKNDHSEFSWVHKTRPVSIHDADYEETITWDY